MARQKDLSSLSAEELNALLEDTTVRLEELQKQLQVRREQEKESFVQELKDQIHARGYSLQDITQALSRGARSSTAAKRKARGFRYYYQNPDDPEHTYTTGPFPKWLKDKMIAENLDPENKEHRRRFKEERLTKVSRDTPET